ncbi:hypothetical protein M2368_002061 [Arthrobacter sp. JUb119]|uniref:hypothetical protein n=1 Tax=Glutamicibacter sp. 2E12 TaxID=3416181 RepID=UPI002A2C9DF9|nr:hypothetical protein [Arthrobacter sp. JUb119]
MGYEVNYNEPDYAQAGEICQRVARDINGISDALLRAAQAAYSCQGDLNLQCMAAGIEARGYGIGHLGDLIRDSYQQAREGEITAFELTGKVSAAMRNYEVAEAAVERMMLVSTSAVLVGDFISKTRDNGWRPPRESMETFLRLLMSYIPHWPLAPNMTLTEQIEGTAKSLSRIMRLLGSNRNTEIELAGQDPAQTVELDGKMRSYFQLHEKLEGEGTENNGKIMIVEADDDTYIALFPGTQDDAEVPSPFGPEGIADGFGVESENFVEPLDEALRLSGAKEGDEVILSGYSQGGIHVAQLTKNKFLKRKYKLNKVLTLGSPIGTIDLPEDIRSLSVEDRKDMVPGTDGGPNPRKGEHYTTTFPGPREHMQDILPEDGLFGPSHHLKNYGDHLLELDEDPKLEIREHLKQFYLPESPLKIRMFKLERKQKERPPLKEEDKERLKHMAPRH